MTANRRGRKKSTQDVQLNQPGRALLECALWWAAGLAFVTLPLGLLCALLAQIGPLEYVFANLAGLFVSNVLRLPILLLVYLVLMVYLPVRVFFPGLVPGPAQEEDR